MLISAVNALTCNMDLIALIDSRCVLPNVGLRSLRVPFGSWQVQGFLRRKNKYLMRLSFVIVRRNSNIPAVWTLIKLKPLNEIIKRVNDFDSTEMCPLTLIGKRYCLHYVRL